VEDDLIENAPLSVRTLNALIYSGIRTFHDLDLTSDEDLLRMPNFGRKCLKEVHEYLAGRGYVRDPAFLNAVAEKEATRRAWKTLRDKGAAELSSIRENVRNQVYSNKSPMMVPVELCCVPDCDRLGKTSVGGLFCCDEHKPRSIEIYDTSNSASMDAAFERRPR
jgi:hypothetical protein